MNIKVLTTNERLYLNRRYSFSVDGNSIFVKVNDFKRVTAHPIGEKINLRSSVRQRLVLSNEALTLWREMYIGKRSPIDIQNAINFLKVSYQEVTNEAIEKALKQIDNLER